MKNQQELVSTVQQEIREDSWNGAQFVYPSYRVALNSASPYTNGQCRPYAFDISFSVYCFAEGTSSKGCLELMSILYQCLQGKKIDTDIIASFSPLDVPQSGIIPPVPEGERGWRGEVLFRTALMTKGI